MMESSRSDYADNASTSAELVPTTGVAATIASSNATANATKFEQFIEQRIEHLLILWLQPIIVLVGTVGNTMSFAVLVRSRMRSTSVYFFLIVLTVADTSVLYASAFKTWIRMLTGFELMNVSNGSCKTVSFLILVSQHLAAWIVVLVTVDRFIAVWFPLRASTVCTVRRAALNTALLAVVTVVYNGHAFWTYELRSKLPVKCVVAKGPWMPFMFAVFPYLRLVTYCLVPFVTIFLLNIAIIVRLRWTSPTLRGHVMRSSVSAARASTSLWTAGPLNDASSVDLSLNAVGVGCVGGGMSCFQSPQQSRVTYMLLSVSIAWVILTAPTAVYALVFRWNDRDPHVFAIHSLVKCVCFLLMYLNHSLNFFLYCVTGKKFRRELADMLCGALPLPLRHRQRSTISSPSVKTLRSNCNEFEMQESIRRRVL